jgi:acyl-CoA thioester hydrolase
MDVPIYRTAIAADWIDYNGHLRDAYYVLIVSLAADALMDRLGMDEHYRRSTQQTLFTLELHMHYLHEVKHSDIVSVNARVIGFDHKRIHAGFDLVCEGREQPAASAELMLIHVHQGATPRTAALPAGILAAVASLAQQSGPRGEHLPGSRRIELRAR